MVSHVARLYLQVYFLPIVDTVKRKQYVKDKDGNVVVDKSKKKSIKREEGDAPSIGWANYLVDKKGQIIKQTGMLRHYFNFSDEKNDAVDVYAFERRSSP